MKKGFLLLLAILFVPLCLVVFLYVFGKNEYNAQNPRYKDVNLSGLGAVSTISAGHIGIITLWPDAPTEQDCRFLDRMLYRLKVVEERGSVAFVPVGRKGLVLGELCHGLPLSMYGFVKTLSPGDSLAYSGLLNRIGMKDDADRVHLTTILTDKKGQVVNVYDLKREPMLDTLVMEGMIIIGD